MGSCRRDQNSFTATDMTPWQLGPDVMAMLPKKPGLIVVKGMSWLPLVVFVSFLFESNIMNCAIVII